MQGLGLMTERRNLEPGLYQCFVLNHGVAICCADCAMHKGPGSQRGPWQRAESILFSLLS